MNVDRTFVSVILPTFNRADTLSRSIGSVLEQQHKNLELIVVDDGSTDRTRELVTLPLIFIRRRLESGHQ